MKVAEIFYSIQGEGFRTGVPEVFIRLSGCSMMCSFCDTKYSWEKGDDMSVKEVIGAVKQFCCRSVCITGGEPTEQPLDELTAELVKDGYYIHLETNGSNPIVGMFSWITVSPKRFINQSAINMAHELKIVVKSKYDLGFVYEYVRGFKGLVYLQPEHGAGERSVLACLEMVKKNPEWRLSVQTQKFLCMK